MAANTIKHVHRYSRLSDGLSFVVELEINVDEISQALAARAIGSKLQKSQALNGDIKCRVISTGDDVERKTMDVAKA